MKLDIGPNRSSASARTSLLVLLACLVCVLSVLFYKSFSPAYALFSNDGPYGVQMANYLRLPGAFLGIWNDLFWLGAYNGNYSPNFTGLLLWGLGPRLFINFYAPLTCLIAGVCAWLFFRVLGLGSAPSVLGGLAAALNGNFFSNACWGLGSRGLALAATFLALAAVHSSGQGQRLLKVILAGLAIGLSISEGADNGAIFSLFVAAYALFLTYQEGGPLARRLALGTGRVALMAVCAGLLALQSLYVFSRVAGKIGGLPETDPVLLSPEEVSNAPALTAELAQGSNPVAATVWSRFSAEAKAVLTNAQTPLGTVRATLADQLNAVFQGPLLYDSQQFANVPLSAQIRKLLAAPQPSSTRVTRLNRLLLEEALPGHWVRLRDKEATLRTQAWDWATQWSLPKVETLRVIIPGLFGYRLDTPGGGNYWGAVGRQPGWEEHHQGFPRHSGAGEYAGVLVVLLAVWAVTNACSRTACAFDLHQRRTIWFWAVAAIVALVLAWGRHAPFYRLVYMLPYFSTIRNPMKFMHPCHMALIILFAYGVAGLAWRYLQPTPQPSQGLRKSPEPGERGAFEKGWLVGAIGLFLLAVVGHFIYSSSRDRLAEYLTTVGFNHLGFARTMAAYSVHEVGIFLLFLGLSLAALVSVQHGLFAGRRAHWATAGLGALLLLDLARANRPWVVYFDLAEKYASNPILDVLRDRPYLHRVTAPTFTLEGQARELMAEFQQMYAIEWVQHHFQLFNIQGLEVAQMPRGQADYIAFNRALASAPARLWQLTNARYILSLAGVAEGLNAAFDPQKKRFRSILLFELPRRPDGLASPDAVTNTTGPYALIEFGGALPRAKLYARWQVITNDAVALQTLADPSFEPEQAVVVNDPVTPSNPNQEAVALPDVEFISYSPRRLELRANPTAPALMLLNDRYDPNWKVWVDGRPARLLRCNFVMRGVQLDPGPHTVTFQFAPQNIGFWVMTACVAIGLLLCGVVIGLELRKRRLAQASASQTTP